MTHHIEDRYHPLRCVCGYEATDTRDLDEHVLAMMHDDKPDAADVALYDWRDEERQP